MIYFIFFYRSANILLEEDETSIVLCDWGSAAEIESLNASVTNYCGTPEYDAPEIASQICFNTDPNDISYSAKIDVWGIGCVLYELLSCKLLDFCLSSISFSTIASHLKYSNYSPFMLDLLALVLQKDPKDRPSAYTLVTYLDKIGQTSSASQSEQRRSSIPQNQYLLNTSSSPCISPSPQKVRKSILSKSLKVPLKMNYSTGTTENPLTLVDIPVIEVRPAKRKVNKKETTSRPVLRRRLA